MSVSQILDITGKVQSIYLPGGSASNYVPYVGAVTDIDIGTQSIVSGEVAPDPPILDISRNLIIVPSVQASGTSTFHTEIIGDGGLSFGAGSAGITSCPSATIVDVTADTVTTSGEVSVGGRLTLDVGGDVTGGLVVDNIEVTQILGPNATDVVSIQRVIPGSVRLQNATLNSLPMAFSIQVATKLDTTSGKIANVPFPSGFGVFQDKDWILAGWHITDSTGNAFYTVPAGEVDAGLLIPFDSVLGINLQKPAAVWQISVLVNSIIYNNTNIGTFGDQPDILCNLTLVRA